MSQIHYKPEKTKRKQYDLGNMEIFDIKEVGFEVSLHSVVGSKETIQPAGVDRVMIVLSGFANTTDDSRRVIRDGALIEIKAGETFEYQGQMRYYLISK